MLVDIKTGIYKRALLLVGGVVALLVSAVLIGEMATSEKFGFIPIAVILGIIGTLLILRYPLIGFALMFFFVSLAPITQFSKALSSGKIVLGASTIPSLIALLLLGIFISKTFLLHEKVKIDRLFLLICGFILWAIITTLWAPDIRLSFIFIFRIIQMMLLYILVLNYCRSKKQLDVFMISFIFGTILAAAIANLTGMTSTGGVTRTSLVNVDPNFFSAGVSLGMILIFYYLRRMKHIVGKVALILGIVFTGFLIIRAQSRGVWIALSASFLISAFMLSDSKSIRNAIKIIILLIGLVISAYFTGIIDKGVISRFETLSQGSEVATSGRSDIWKVGLKIIIDTFPFGVGFRNFPIASRQYAPTLNMYHVPGGGDAHNVFICVLAETGLIGFSIFVGIFIYLFKGVWRLMSSIERFTYMWLLADLVFISLSLDFHYSSWFWSALIFIALGVKLDKQFAFRNSQGLYIP